MQSWIALLRAINVSGSNIIKMKPLADMLANMGCIGVKTYIQSGNLYFQHPEQSSQLLVQQISQNMQQTFECSPHVFLLTAEALKQAFANNPFTEAELKSVHWFFLSERPEQPNLTILDDVKKESESYVLSDNVFYLHAPEGIGRSKVVLKVEKSLGVNCTARNGNTVAKLLSFIN